MSCRYQKPSSKIGIPPKRTEYRPFSIFTRAEKKIWYATANGLRSGAKKFETPRSGPTARTQGRTEERPRQFLFSGPSGSPRACAGTIRRKIVGFDDVPPSAPLCG